MTITATKPSVPQRSVLRGPLRSAIFVLAALVLVAVTVAGWFGVSWYQAAHDKSLAVSMDRDAVLRDAQRAMLTLNTLDYRHVQDGLALWEQFATGSLLNQLRSNHDSYVKAIIDSSTVSNATVLHAAVASLDERAGAAQVLVGVDVTSQIDKGDPSCAHRRVRLDMVRLGDGWKVAMLEPVGETYSEAGPCPPAASAK